MTVEVTHELEVCSDCTIFIANGDGPEYPTLNEDGDEAYEKRLAEIVEGVEAFLPGHVVLACEEDCEGGFSWSQCGCCGSRLGGDRHPAAVLTETKHETNTKG